MKKQSLVVLLLLLFVFAMAGCSGSDGAAGLPGASGSDGSDGSDGTNGIGASTGTLTASIDSVVSAASGTGQALTITFTVKDSSGALISNLTETSTSDAGQRLSHLRLAAAKLTAGAATGDATHWTSYFQGERNRTRLTDNGDGTYTYVTLPFDAALYDASAHSRVGLQISGLTGIDPLNLTYDFAPDGSSITALTRDVVTTAACAACHDTGNPIAHGSRYETKFCVVCHNAETSRGGHTVDFKSLIHEIHTGQTTSALDASGVAFPQDVRNCTTCHQGTDAMAPTIEACGSCHTGANFATGVGHTGGIKTNAQCAGCHDATAIEGYHQSNYATAHNAGLTGADNFEYVISSVTLTAAGTEYQYATIVFQILNNGTAVNLATGFTGTNLTGYLKGPSIGVTYAYAQDGITNPSDWNNYVSTTLSGLKAGTSGTITADAAGTTMTAVLSGATTTALAIPNAATMVTGYIAGNFIDQNWAAKETAAGRTVSEPTGSARPGKASIKTATGQTARRTIADTAKCNSCHEQLGTEPNFHSGSYNIVMCGICHNPNRSSSGWTASYRAYIHGIHGASKRTVPYTWHAPSATETYAELEYPGKLNDCLQCHATGGYDYSASVYTANSGSVMDRMLLSTAATGTFAATSYTASPYVVKDGVTNYGKGYSIANGADTSTPPTVTAATGATLFHTPITAACSACHDSSSAISHMKSNGGSFYAVRSAGTTNNESCLVCHGPGKIAAIADVHK